MSAAPSASQTWFLCITKDARKKNSPNMLVISGSWEDSFKIAEDRLYLLNKTEKPYNVAKVGKQ